MEKLKLTYTHDSAVANIIMDDGKGNILDDVMMNEMLNVFNDLKSNKDIKLITFEGAGKHFSFGASVEEHTKERAGGMLKTFHKLFYSIMDMGIPTVAKIWGQCLGGGLELALACNVIYTDKTARLGQPEIMLGVFPPPASIILPLKIGTARAEELLITGRSISAESGQEMGLINEVYDDIQSLNSALDTWIEKFILPKSASSLKFAIKAARTNFNTILKSKLPVVEKMYVDQLMNTEDANEGINAFIEKRKPVWKNC
ncbi:MAG: cyclohexa-1,5-dienecarbonyl-CoA hydratase [Bacteroidetes bacterium]|nr:MAG: cyclohexa-1,5-dienecarbonyl-CoA hydratase [Bacteroidota bacterium]